MINLAAHFIAPHALMEIGKKCNLLNQFPRKIGHVSQLIGLINGIALYAINNAYTSQEDVQKKRILSIVAVATTNTTIILLMLNRGILELTNSQIIELSLVNGFSASAVNHFSG